MTTETESHYEPLVAREFKSAIPAHLLGKLDESERYMVETMSKLEHQYDWLLQTAQAQNKAILDLDRRQSLAEKWKLDAEGQLKDVMDTRKTLQALWDWKNTVTGKTGMVLLGVTIVVPVVMKFILDFILKRLGP